MLFLFFFIYIRPVERHIPYQAQSAIRSILFKYNLSKITGDYWEDEMLVQWQYVSKMPVATRVDFLREIILNCEMESTKAMTFSEIALNDAAPLKSNLLMLISSKKYIELSKMQRQAIESWIKTLDVLELRPDLGAKTPVIMSTMNHI